MSSTSEQPVPLLATSGPTPLAVPVEPYEQRLAASISYVLDEGGRLFMGESEVNKTLKRITKELEELNVPYAVAGGMAMIAHGYKRFTDDVGILVDRAGLERIHEALDGRGWVRPFSKSKNLRDANTGVKVEFLITGDYPGDGKPKPVAFPSPEKVAKPIQGIKYLDVVALINLKLASFMTGTDRSKDQGDVVELMKALNLSDELIDVVDPYVRPLYAQLCEQLSLTARPFIRVWEGKLPPGLPSSGPELARALTAVDPTLAPMFADGITAELVKGKRETHVKLATRDRKVARKYEMVDESEALLD
jgi:hypothetical protein